MHVNGSRKIDLLSTCKENWYRTEITVLLEVGYSMSN